MGTSDARVSLREITVDNVDAVLQLRLAPGQERFIMENAASIACSCYERTSWRRAICAGETVVGFLLLIERPVGERTWLWRLMIDAAHQRAGHGRRALELALDEVRSRPGVDALYTSVVEGAGGPLGFYLGLGFVETGERDPDDENILRLALEPHA